MAHLLDVSPAFIVFLGYFQVLQHGEAEKPSEWRATLSERIAQARRLARAPEQKQDPPRVP